jgi:8-oxo-dGTP pyrophosphatase MutT (NUDIX family)
MCPDHRRRLDHHHADGGADGRDLLRAGEIGSMKFPKARKKSATGAEPARQYAALPWRMAERAEILLASSRETRRWVIPKGWPMKGRKPHMTAAIEALQEAGLLGKIAKTTFGAFHYEKRLKNGAVLLCRVDVFLLRVSRQRKSWPEKDQRVTQWFSPTDAAQLVDEPELSALIKTFEDGLAHGLRS